ncbi:radical SAM protein [Brucella sp. IR073]|uniref:radical SAM protein n=1 Tax=unclassified Brucella TaxID=2632610 RepID=UPI003B98657E
MLIEATNVFGALKEAGGGRIDNTGLIHVPSEIWSYAALWPVHTAKSGPMTIMLELEEGDGGHIGLMCVDETLSIAVSEEVFVRSDKARRVEINVPAIEKVKALVLRKGPGDEKPTKVRPGRPTLVKKTDLRVENPSLATPSSRYKFDNPSDLREEIKYRNLDTQIYLETQIKDIVAAVSREDIIAALPDDLWQQNYALNWWEYYHRSDVLSSRPWKLMLPIADLCNARCTFCNSWLDGRNVLTPAQLERYAEILPYAHEIGIEGHGEPLANPHIDTILKRVAELTDSRAQSYIISNGMFLKRRLQALLDARITTYNFSLNAASNETHHKVMGLGEDALDTVLDAVREIVRQRERDPRILVTVSMVLTRDNFHETADFIRLANDLGVDWVYLRTLIPAQHLKAGLNYHLLPPILHPDFEKLKAEALAVAAESKVHIEMQPETWHVDALPKQIRADAAAGRIPFVTREQALKDRDIRNTFKSDYEQTKGYGRYVPEVESGYYDPFGRSAPFSCQFIYQQFRTSELTFRASPCCYMTHVPGHEKVVFDGTRPFMDYWNSIAFVNLRRRLRDGPLYANCLSCPMQG